MKRDFGLKENGMKGGETAVKFYLKLKFLSLEQKNSMS